MCGGTLVQSGHLVANGGTISEFSAAIPMFAPEVNRLVINRTGLLGLFDVDLTWAPETTANETDGRGGAPSFFTALQEQLGLKLEPSSSLVDVLVIDHVERPTED
jgi:uncharacterized protein (TIGR03435 family)